MKNYKIILLALAALGIASCTEQARINGTVNGAADSDIVVRKLDMNQYKVLDTIKTKADGSFSYKLDVEKGQPEFIYLFYGDTKIASLLLETGETAAVTTDTLGKYQVVGSEGSAKLAEVEQRYADFLTRFYNAPDTKEMSRIYVDYYRNCVKYVLSNSKSLTSIPVLYQEVSADSPVFAQQTDAIIFRQVADSLKTVYPASRYVQALDKAAASREQELAVQTQLSAARINNFPDLNIADINGNKVRLSEIDAKAILLHFWTSAADDQKMLSLEYLIPLYEEFHDRGLEIYAVGIDPDKARWAGVVNSQKLPWINVNDGLGSSSPSLVLYNVGSLPSSLLIADGELDLNNFQGVDGLRKELRNLLK